MTVLTTCSVQVLVHLIIIKTDGTRSHQLDGCAFTSEEQHNTQKSADLAFELVGAFARCRTEEIA